MKSDPQRPGFAVALLLVATLMAGKVRAAQEQYQYDALGRLKVVQYTTGQQMSYTYDPAGNRRVQSSQGAMSVTDSLSMTPGSYNCGPNNCPYALFGYVRTGGLPSVGSMASASLSGGKTLSNFYDRLSGSNYSFVYAEVAISGFGADPGKGWLVSAGALNQTKTGATATYAYSAGVATWHWTSPWGFNGAPSTATAIKIAHQ